MIKNTWIRTSSSRVSYGAGMITPSESSIIVVHQESNPSGYDNLHLWKHWLIHWLSHFLHDYIYQRSQELWTCRNLNGALEFSFIIQMSDSTTCPSWTFAAETTECVIEFVVCLQRKLGGHFRISLLTFLWCESHQVLVIRRDTRDFADYV